MNILVVSHEYPPIGGGGANACFYLCRELVKLGHSITLVTASYADLPAHEKDGSLEIVRVKCKRTDESKSSFSEMLSYLMSALKYCNKRVKAERFDICQVYFGIPSGPIGWFLKKKYKIPYVVRFGGGDIPGTQKRFGIMYKVLAPFVRAIWKNASALVANSVELRDMAYAFEDAYEVSVINNGVDIERFVNTVDRDLSEKSILFVSRIIERKGLQFMIPYMKRIHDETGARLTIVGDGPYREELIRIATETDTMEYIRFCGKLTGEPLVKEYLSADMFILPSAWEGMPNVVLEAMAAGLPVIMTPCGGSSELIDGNGYVASVDEFADRIIELCRDDELRGRMAESSRLRARDMFSWTQKAREYEHMYEELL